MRSLRGQHSAGRLTAAIGVGITLLAWVLGTVLPVRAAPSRQVGVMVHIINPPFAITDLSASPVGSQNGDVQLVWTAPRNENGARIDRYLVRHATFPASVGTAAAWWNQSAATEIVFGPAHLPTVVEFGTISGLTLGVEHYFSIKSVDEDGSVSGLDARTLAGNPAHSVPSTSGSSGPPATPTHLSATVLSSTTIQWNWDLSTGANFYLLKASPGGALIAQTGAVTVIETGLTANVRVNRTITAANVNGLSAPSSPMAVYTFANPPTAVTLGLVTPSSVRFSWSSPGNPVGTKYQIERSLDGSVFATVGLISTTTFIDEFLNEETTYYFRIRSMNGDGVLTAPSSAVSAFTPKKVDLVAPRAPMGLKGTLDPTGHAFLLLWEVVTNNTDDSPVTDLIGYNVYRRASITGPATRLNSLPLTIRTVADQVDGQTFYYTIRAVDSSGNESEDSLLADSSSQQNVIFLSNDGLSTVSMPESVNGLLRSGSNKYGVPLTIKMAEVPLPQTASNVLRSVRLTLVRGDNGKELDDIAFAKPQAIVAVGYATVNGQPARGRPLSPSAAAASGLPSAGVAPEDLSMYWNNDVTWVKVGGTVDRVNQVVKIKSSFLGEYQLRTSAAASSVSLPAGNVYPRLFTPNGDGMNDVVFFVFENPNNATVSGEILDKDGRHVATLPPPAATGIGTTLIWNGKDDHGQVVPGGVYLYRLTGEGHDFTGSVGVAR